MGFKGYKLKHKLIILKSLQDQADHSSAYAKTFDITLFISTTRPGIIRFDELEALIDNTLRKFSEKDLDEVPPFDQLEPSLENIGTVFYQLIKQNLARIEATLEMLEICESPVRTFIVNEASARERLYIGDKKIKISSLIVENLISQSISNIISKIEKAEPAVIPVEPAPQPEAEEEEPTKEKLKQLQEPTQVEVQKSSIPVPALIISKKTKLFRFVLSILCLTAFGSLTALYLKNTGAYPSGADIYGHLFKADFLYDSIKNGDLYPIYTKLWYNGIQPYRYWAPLPYYIMAFLQFIAGGDVLTAYLLFIVFAIVVGGIGWLLWGLTYNRMLLCTFLAGLWFCLPDNIRVFFVEGNLPRMVIAMILPYLFYFLWRFIENRVRWAIVPVIIFMCMITLCHAMIAAMTGVTTFVFLLIYSVSHRRVKESIYIICGMLLSFALCGIWLFPALKGGLVSMDASATAEVMKALSTPILVSLNPALRSVGLYELFYFGISILTLSIVGLFLAGRKSKVGFYTVIIIFCGTTTAFVPFLEKLPLNQVFWMVRFTPIVYAIFILSLLEWKKCRRYAMILMMLFIVVDSVPSMDLQRYHSQTPSLFTYTLDEAKAITNQRISLLDVSAYGSYPSYGITSEEPAMQYTFGWAWQAAATASNIVMVNTALEKGYYYYMFDRSLELGDDTILVRKELVKQAKKTLDELTEAASASGYTLYKETNYTYIFHRITPKTFGVTTEYSGLAIGRNARSVALEYPSFEEGSSQTLTDYSLDKLRKYRVIYLSGFKYSDRKQAEELLTMAADTGVKIIIDMNQIPVDPVTSRMTLFDVTAQSITFSVQYPELMYRNKIYEAVPFKREYSTWNTVYLENLKDIQGYSWFQNKELAFMGTRGNENIIFLGYNILYHAMESNDDSVRSLMSDLLKMEPNQLPERRVIPLRVEYGKDKLIIESPGVNVNTTIAYQDNFRSNEKIINNNNLLVVNKPYTEIRMVYPYMLQGLSVSIIGLLGIISLLFFIFKKRRYTSEND